MNLPKRIRSNDIFVAANVILFLFMCSTVYLHRFITYRGFGNIHEFFVYACVILGLIFAFWWKFRAFQFPTTLLTLVQIGIVLHFSGAFFPIPEGRLYDAVIFGLRYDKYVHAFNAFTGSALTLFLIDRMRTNTPFMGLLVILITMGGGAFVEIVEYLVARTVPHNGVGGYDNNMQDLVSNFVGAVLFFVLVRVKESAAKAAPRQAMALEQ